MCEIFEYPLKFTTNFFYKLSGDYIFSPFVGIIIIYIKDKLTLKMCILIFNFLHLLKGNKLLIAFIHETIKFNPSLFFAL